MKIFKRIITLCLLVVAAVMFIPGVLAAISTDNNSLTVSGLETGTDKNVSVNLYKIMNVNTQNGQPKDPVYVWDSNVATWLNSQANYKKFVGDNNVVTADFNKDLSNTEVAKFYDDLSAAIRSGAITGVTANTKQAGGAASVSYTGLDLGVYFVLANGGMKVYKPTSVNIVPEKNATTGDWEVKNTSVELKSSGPGVVKKVEGEDAATGKIGQKVKYTLEITVPEYPENTTNKTLYLEDQLSAGLDLVEVSEGNYDVKVVADGEELTINENYSLSYTDRKITIHFDGEFYSTIKDYDKITVTYYATINKDAVIYDTDPEGNINTVTLHYNNDPYGNEDPKPTDKVTVYTYGLDLKKVDKKDHTKVLNGAEFTVSANQDGSNPLKFVKISDGVYRLVEAGETGTDKLVATNGTLKVQGLDVGKYYVTETKAPVGYVIDPTHHELEIKDANVDGKVDAEDSTTALLYAEIENSDSVINLPVTGGIGTLIFSVIGILFMGLSVVLVRNILKKKEVQL